jgi:hypothetical protein
VIVVDAVGDAVVHDQREALHAGHVDVDADDGRTVREHAGIEDDRAVGDDLEIDRVSLGADFVIQTDVGDEILVRAGEVVIDLRYRMRADAAA